MKILHISTSDTGGAANACIRLHQGLLELGVDSKVLVFLKRRNIPEVYQFYENKSSNYILDKYRFFKFGFYEGINRLMLLNRVKGNEIFTYPKSLIPLHNHPLVQEADVIHLRWVSYFLNYSTFFKNVKDKKIVWTLSDMNPFTGGCHYALDCRKFQNDCTDCPQLQGSIWSDYSKFILDKKLKALKDVNNISVVSPSQWMMEESKSSRLFGRFTNYFIPNGIDTDEYKILDKIKVRDKLKLPRDRIIFLFVADSLDRRLKGFGILVNVLKKHFNNNKNILLLTIGSQKNKLEIEGVDIINLGYLSSEEKLNEAYSAADVFITPSLAESFGNTVLESMLCGTPVIGFPVGGVKEQIINGKNGILSRDITEDALAESINEFVNKKYIFESNKIREISEKNYNLRQYAEKYLEIYKSQ
jgi:glycosyltransferase involved in cell wall biosynthesis